jgi:hypothetical protein
MQSILFISFIIATLISGGVTLKQLNDGRVQAVVKQIVR